KAVEWPALFAEAEAQIQSMKNYVLKNGAGNDKQNAATLERETRQAMTLHDPKLLRSKIRAVRGLETPELEPQPGYCLALLDELKERKSTLRNPSQAEQLFAQAERAIRNDNVAGLEAAVRQLIDLLPEGQQQGVGKHPKSTVI